MVIAELDCVMTVPINPMRINHSRCICVYCDRSMLSFKNLILSFIYSNHKKTIHRLMMMRKMLRYLLEKKAPSHHTAIIGITTGFISNHKPKSPISASINTDQIFIPMTTEIAWLRAIIPLPTNAKIIRETAWLDCSILTSHTPRNKDFRLERVIKVIHLWMKDHHDFALSSIRSSANKNRAIPQRNCRKVTRDIKEQLKNKRYLSIMCYAISLITSLIRVFRVSSISLLSSFFSIIRPENSS